MNSEGPAMISSLKRYVDFVYKTVLKDGATASVVVRQQKVWHRRIGLATEEGRSKQRCEMLEF